MLESLLNLQQLVINRLIELSDYYVIRLYRDTIELQGEYSDQKNLKLQKKGFLYIDRKTHIDLTISNYKFEIINFKKCQKEKKPKLANLEDLAVLVKWGQLISWNRLD